MKVYALTDVGTVRSNNEDCFYAPDKGERFCAVADGMGGCNAGEVASALAAQVFSTELCTHRVLSRPAVREAIEAANAAVWEEAYDNPDCSGMGTTFTALAFEKKIAILGHVGDSRAYRIRGGAIEQLSQDHSWVAEMVRAGELTPEQAAHHPRRNLITRALGVSERVQADVTQYPVEEGDIFLLCTDGVCGSVSDEEMLAVALGEGGWQEKTQALIALALKNGSRDNATCMFVIPGEEDE